MLKRMYTQNNDECNVIADYDDLNFDNVELDIDEIEKMADSIEQDIFAIDSELIETKYILDVQSN